MQIQRSRAGQTDRISRILLRGALAICVLLGASTATAQEEVPIVISPLRVESDPNGVNLISGKVDIEPPVLAVPAAPNLRFDRVQNAAPYFSGTVSTASGETISNYSVHTNAGMSESFRCEGSVCESLTGSGSVFRPEGLYTRGGSGEVYTFDLQHLNVGPPVTSLATLVFYASSVRYANGEVLTYTYDTGTIAGDPYGRVYYRPTRVSSNLGYFISISYHPGQLGTDAWARPAEAAIYQASNPSTPLRRFTYSSDGTTVTEVAGSFTRAYTCIACRNQLGLSIELSYGSMTLPGETTPAIQATANQSHPLVATVARDGVQWNYSYTNPRYNGSTDGYWYDRLSVTGPNGYSMVYDLHVYNRRNVIDKVTDSGGRQTTFETDYYYRPTRVVYPEGNEATVAYDLLGNAISRTVKPKPGSSLVPVSEAANYDTTGCNNIDFHIRCFRPTWFRDGLGRQTDFAYNTAGQLTERTDPADADGVRRKTYVTYDSSTGISRPSVVRVCGDVTTCNTADEIRTEYQYWGNTLLPWVVRRIDAARGETLVTTNTYDAAGRLKISDGPMPGTDDATYYHYDQYGRNSWSIGPLNAAGYRRATKTEYDDSDDKIRAVEVGSVTNVTAPAFVTVLARSETEYDGRRNPVVERGKSSDGTIYRLTQRTFDDRGRLTCEARRMNAAAFGSLPADACTLGASGSFGDDRITRNVWDATSQLLQVHRAYGTPIQINYATYTYTPNGKQETVTDANGNMTTFEYDGLDRLSKTRFPVATLAAGTSSTTDYEQYGYDGIGNRTSLRRRDGKIIAYTYDALNRVRSKSVPVSTTGVAGYSVFYGYDVRGLQMFARFGSISGTGITTQYDGFGRPTSSSTNMDGTARAVTSVYDVHGNRTRVTHPDGVFFEYSYDPADNLEYIRENGSSIELVRNRIDQFGRRDQITRNVTGSFTTIGFDAISRLLSIGHNLDGAGTGNDVGIGFSYNPASQVAARSQTNSTYDYPIGVVEQTYTSNGRNQYTQIAGTNGGAPTWDANGNLTSDGLPAPTTFKYDTENRLTGASGAKIATLTYDPLGRLYQVSNASGTTRFLYDGDRLIAEYNTAGTVQRRYVHGANVDEPMVWYEGSTVSSATRRYLHADHQGSIVAATNATGTTLNVGTYDAYGVTTAPSTWRFQYTGQTAVQQVGLYYYKARFYNPALGRFMQTDPIGYDDDLNLYAYTYNDPLNKTDPTGECPWCYAVAAGGGALIGGAVEALRQRSAGGKLSWSKIGTSALKAAVVGVGAVAGGSAAVMMRGALADGFTAAAGSATGAAAATITTNTPIDVLTGQKSPGDVNEQTLVSDAKAAAANGAGAFVGSGVGSAMDAGIAAAGPRAASGIGAVTAGAIKETAAATGDLATSTGLGGVLDQVGRTTSPCADAKQTCSR